MCSILCFTSKINAILTETPSLPHRLESSTQIFLVSILCLSIFFVGILSPCNQFLVVHSNTGYLTCSSDAVRIPFVIVFCECVNLYHMSFVVKCLFYTYFTTVQIREISMLDDHNRAPRKHVKAHSHCAIAIRTKLFLT